MIHNESLARLLSVRKLARSWSISNQEKFLTVSNVLLPWDHFPYYLKVICLKSLPLFIKFSNTFAFVVSELQQRVFFKKDQQFLATYNFISLYFFIHLQHKILEIRDNTVSENLFLSMFMGWPSSLLIILKLRNPITANVSVLYILQMIIVFIILWTARWYVFLFLFCLNISFLMDYFSFFKLRGDQLN